MVEIKDSLRGLFFILIVFNQVACTSLKKSHYSDKDDKIAKVYDDKNHLVIENIYQKNKYIKSLWHTEKSEVYDCKLPIYKNLNLFKNKEQYNQFLIKHHNDTKFCFEGVYYVYLLVSNKGRVLDGHIISKTKGCYDCDSLTIRTIEILKNTTSTININYDKKENTIKLLKIPFGKIFN